MATGVAVIQSRADAGGHAWFGVVRAKALGTSGARSECSRASVRLSRGMDSLLYVGGADDDDDDEDDDDEGVDAGEGEEAKAAAAAASAPKPVDFAALQRAGYASSSLTSTDTYARLTKEEEETKEEEKKERERADREKVDAMVADEESRSNLLDKRKLDAKIGYKKRFDETHEDFRSKEKRKRQLGQQNRDGNWVEEEKRALRHSGANFDS